jgi:hypothetical protein
MKTQKTQKTASLAEKTSSVFQKKTAAATRTATRFTMKTVLMSHKLQKNKVLLAEFT